VLEYCSAGHHPALLLAPGGGVVVALDRNNERVGAMEGAAYTATRVRVRPGCRLYLFSEGAFAVQTADGGTWGPAEIAGLVRAAPAGGPISLEPERIYAAVRDAARPGPLADDFSVVVIGFP
jgi:serine phosphatase RsbU (regulator of sigma subunit)